jgi:mono/diheme cytochrome c family protein
VGTRPSYNKTTRARLIQCSRRAARGERLYAASCASCHGANGEGQPNWKERGPDGTLPSPPHDQSGHTWHHADGVLLRIVRDGCAADQASGPCRMPAFLGTLSDEQIVAVIEHLRSWWGAEDRSFQAQVPLDEPFAEMRIIAVTSRCEGCR